MTGFTAMVKYGVGGTKKVSFRTLSRLLRFVQAVTVAPYLRTQERLSTLFREFRRHEPRTSKTVDTYG